MSIAAPFPYGQSPPVRGNPIGIFVGKGLPWSIPASSHTREVG